MRISWEGGEKKMKPVEFRLREFVTPRRWRSDKVEYYIETDFGRVGPIADRNEALRLLELARRC